MVQNQSKPTVESDTPEACRRVEERQAENRERFWKVVEEIGERNADKDPDEVMRLVSEEVEEVRQEQYERDQCAKHGR